MLKALRNPSGGKPRQATAEQAYLSANAERVREIYEVRKQSEQQTGITLRLKIASELFGAESVEELPIIFRTLFLVSEFRWHEPSKLRLGCETRKMHVFKI